MREIIVGTRKSKLALIQTNWVIEQLRKAGIKNEIKVKKFETMGDKTLNVSLTKLGGNGVFIKEIDQEMIDKEIDFAVHSMKDLPVTLPDSLMIASIPVREDNRDAYIANHHIKLNDLPRGAIIGTSSARRSAQILGERPDICTKWIRGPIDSRISQLQEGNYDAIILAVAGLKRLGVDKEVITEYLPVDKFIPAIGQGALAIECRKDDEEVRGILSAINDDDSEITVRTERKFIELLKGSDQAPIGAYAYLEKDEIVLHVNLATSDGVTILNEIVSGMDPDEVALKAVNALMSKGAFEILKSYEEGL